ncbi:uncharacterized protein LOC17900256 [Capsella rubella]|uniref:uncharacterized protein LOC17900256 n=1 Tax=Capsella rubella TaxID=81985 RepID=UPI000CD4F188|nr:uncharacterized protein LOC17900256 [Capsella rubella]
MLLMSAGLSTYIKSQKNIRWGYLSIYIKPSSPPQVAETGKKVPPSPLPPKGAEMAKRQPPPKFKGIPVKDGGYVVSKSNKTTAKSTRRRSRYGNDAGGFGGCGGGCGGGGGC